VLLTHIPPRHPRMCQKSPKSGGFRLPWGAFVFLILALGALAISLILAIFTVVFWGHEKGCPTRLSAPSPRAT
jgi:hypothetical protein